MVRRELHPSLFLFCFFPLRLQGMQPHVVQEYQRDRQHARVLPQPNHRVAIPEHDQGHHLDGAHNEVLTVCITGCSAEKEKRFFFD